MNEPFVGERDGLVLQSLKGAPATVLWALALSPRGCTGRDLARLTGYSDKPVRRAVLDLARAGCIVDDGRGRWRLAPVLRRRLANLAPEQQDTGPPHDPARRRLRVMLSEAGIVPPTLDRLLRRPELLADPDRVKAWRWYVATQSWASNPPGLLVSLLDEGRRPPPGFLQLARCWPQVVPDDRRRMRELFWRAWKAPELAHAFHEPYPQLTTVACEAYLQLVKAAPQLLGY
jgi:hypothetical protein